MPPPPKRVKINHQNRHKTSAELPSIPSTVWWLNHPDFGLFWKGQESGALPPGPRSSQARGGGICGEPRCHRPVPLSFSLWLCLSFFPTVFCVFVHHSVAWSLSPGLCWSLPDDLSLSEHEISHLCFPVHLLFPFSLSLSLQTGFLISAETQLVFSWP